MSIKLKIKRAQITNRTTILLGNMSPLVRITYGTEIKETKICQDGHDEPIWDEEFVFTKSDEFIINLQIIDSGCPDSDKSLICESSILIDRKNSEQLDEESNSKFKKLKFEGEPAGKILYDISVIS